jgi:predicted alpha/beta-fold hydrolase
LTHAPSYRPPFWLPGGQLQTIWPALHGRRVAPPTRYKRARWIAPDQDFIDVDWLDMAPTLGTDVSSLPPEGAGLAWGGPARRPASHSPLLVLFHGLEGSSQSHYARAFASHAQQLGWAYAVPHFRGCSGEINLAPRAYHSGDYPEMDWILRRFRREHSGPIIVVGISMGGNVLLRWAEEMGHSATEVVSAVATICTPLDIGARLQPPRLHAHVFEDHAPQGLAEAAAVSRPV